MSEITREGKQRIADSLHQFVELDWVKYFARIEHLEDGHVRVLIAVQSSGSNDPSAAHVAAGQSCYSPVLGNAIWLARHGWREKAQSQHSENAVDKMDTESSKALQMDCLVEDLFLAMP